MIFADTAVPYPRQYFVPKGQSDVDDELYAGYIVVRPGADPLFVWWSTVRAPNPFNRTEAELQQRCDSVNGIPQHTVRTYPAPHLIHPKYLHEDG